MKNRIESRAHYAPEPARREGQMTGVCDKDNGDHTVRGVDGSCAKLWFGLSRV